MTDRPRLLLLLVHGADPQRHAVAPAVAAAALRAGSAFELYVDEPRLGRHFGGGDPALAPPGSASGSLVAGGGHVEQVLWLCRAYAVTAVGDPAALLWPVLEQAGAALLPARGPAETYRAVLDALGQPVPALALVLDAQPQGPHGVVVAPYLAPELLDGPPALALEAGADAAERAAMRALGTTRFEARWVAPERAGWVDAAEGEVGDADYPELTVLLAERHRAWAGGALLADPDLVAAQLPRTAARRLLPLYGRPHTAVIERAAHLLRDLPGPVLGRQYDDHDFFALAPLGLGLQLVDAGPPFEALRGRAATVVDRPAPPEVPDAQLRQWADQGRVLTTLVFWSGMVRELDCLPRLVDLVGATGLQGGLVLTDDAVEHALRPPLTLLAEPPERGGVAGRLELLLGSLGEGVAPEHLLPEGALAAALGRSRARWARLLPPALQPRGWWPILDAPMQEPWPGRVRLEQGRPVVRLPGRGGSGGAADLSPAAPARDLRARVGAALRSAGLDDVLEQDRPFSWRRPGALDPAVATAVEGAGFRWMLSKSGVGTPRLVHRSGDFVALPLTAGVWGGWTPFWTVDGLPALRRAERRLLRGGPGWLVGTLDAPLWLTSGGVWERASELHDIARWAAAGGDTGRLVPTTPDVVARYARLLDDRS